MRILVVAPHPDDETLGAGGTLLKRKKMGDSIYWLIITHASKENGWGEEYVEKRNKQIDSISEFYGFEGVFNLGYAPSGLTRVNEVELIEKISEIFKLIKPDWLIIPGGFDAHSDHRVTYNCSMAAAKTFRMPFIKRIMEMEILSETDQGFQLEHFVPNTFIDIGEEIEKKISALCIYDTELQDPPFPRSVQNVRAMAQIRGASCNLLYAEAFRIIRLME